MHLLSEVSLRVEVVEHYWGAVKQYTRENRIYSSPEIEHTIRAGFDSVSLRTIQRFAYRARRRVDAYLGRLNEKQQEFVEMQNLHFVGSWGKHLSRLSKKLAANQSLWISMSC